MLIICSECHKEFSDKSQTCPHCGCPINQMDLSNYCNINGILYDFNSILELALNVGEKPTDVYPLAVSGAIRRATQLDWDSSKQLADILIQTKTVPKQFEGTIEVRHNNNNEISNIPKCPTCGSTNIKTISTTERAVSVIGLGLLSKKINKTYKCLNCKCTW